MFARRPPPTLGVGVKMSKFNFFRACHVAYHIKWNHACSNIVANILPADPNPPPTLEGGVKMSKFNFFRTWSCGISNLMESRMQQHASTYSVLTHTLDRLVGSKVKTIFVSESSHVAYQIRRGLSIEHHASTYSVQQPIYGAVLLLIIHCLLLLPLVCFCWVLVLWCPLSFSSHLAE